MVGSFTRPLDFCELPLNFDWTAAARCESVARFTKELNKLNIADIEIKKLSCVIVLYYN